MGLGVRSVLRGRVFESRHHDHDTDHDHDHGHDHAPEVATPLDAGGTAGISSAAATKVATTDGLFSGYKWAVSTLTYSFPTQTSDYGYTTEINNNFAAATAAQQTAVTAALAAVAGLTNLSFTHASDGTGVLRFARSDAPSTAYAYLPNSAEQGGDVWYRNSGGTYATQTVGTYAFHTTLHELGHALGLKHGHEASGSWKALSGAHNSMEYTVMTYASYAGASTRTGYTNESTSYAQSFMMHDIAALQALYGADFTTNSGNTTYTWSPTTGEMSINGAGQGDPAGDTIFLTIWDGGGTDTYDLSNYSTNLTLDLNPGKWNTFATAQLALLHGNGSKIAVGNVANALQYQSDARSLIENATGGSGADKIVGNLLGNTFIGGAGNDTLDGGKGDDFLFGGAGSDSLIGGDGRDTVSYAGAGAAVTVNMTTGGTGGDAAGDKFTLIEILVGSSHGDTLTGSTKADHIEGGAGADTIIGGAGMDTLVGGLGDDVFRLLTIVESGLGATKRDVITDFTNGDKIDLSLIDANTKLTGMQDFSLISGATFTAAGQLKVAYEFVSSVEYTVLSGSNDADTATEFQIALLGHLTLTSSDFIL